MCLKREMQTLCGEVKHSLITRDSGKHENIPGVKFLPPYEAIRISFWFGTVMASSKRRQLR